MHFARSGSASSRWSTLCSCRQTPPPATTTIRAANRHVDKMLGLGQQGPAKVKMLKGRRRRELLQTLLRIAHCLGGRGPKKMLIFAARELMLEMLEPI